MDSIAQRFGRTLVIAPHPDDEVLGAGGLIARLADAGQDTFVAVITKGQPPAFTEASVAAVRDEARAAHAILGVTETLWLDQPAAELSEVPHIQLNAAIGETVRAIRPDTLVLPFLGDIHLDHQLIFNSAMVAARPRQADYPGQVLAYECLSETNWNAPYLTPGFLPNVFVDISATLERKLEAMQAFKSQLQPAPNERSLEALRALAILRGATIHRAAAEAFVNIRQVS